MKNNDKNLVFVGDFETTVFEGQEYTEVWASACCELFSDDVKIFHSIDEQFEYFKSLNKNIICYYHNLKFDGNFWLAFVIEKLDYKLAATYDRNDITTFKWKENRDMPFKSYKYMISATGLWYSFRIQIDKHYIELRDSYKLLPFSVKKIGESFKTKHKKLEMEYVGFRYAGCTITDEEKEYIKNDILVIKEAMEIMYQKGHKKLTIGSCCFSEFKSITGSKFKSLYPYLYDIELEKEKYGESNAGEYLRNSYRGGWCYLVPRFANKVIKKGVTYDVNSLYPSVMHSESGNAYPVGKPTFWSGNFIPPEARDGKHFYFLRIKTRFYLRKGKLPFVQIKNNLLYHPNEMLITSDIYDRKLKGYSRYYIDRFGNVKDSYVILTMTMTDFKLFIEHYIVEDFSVLDGCYFQSKIGIFDDYIDKYKQIKMTSSGAVKQLAKLFLNNLYGKMATNTDSSFKVAYVKEDGSIGFYNVPEHDKKGGYIAIGSAVTSYARDFTIRVAQMNYKSEGDDGFIYADTDSIHCRLNPEDAVGIKIHDTDFCCWKCESVWDEGIFVRAKTYIETTQNDDEIIYDIKCAGMPQNCKNLFIKSITRDFNENDYNETELEFLKETRTLKDFKVGLVVPSKLMPKNIRGGIVLLPTTFKLRGNNF